MSNKELLLEMKSIKKSFHGVRVLNNVDFNLQKGEIHALIGENGAGKSTLMNILAGVHKKDGGEILYLNKSVEILNPKYAQSLGISIIHQELNLIPDLTIAQNIFIGREPLKPKSIFLDDKKINNDAEILFRKLSLNIDVNAKVVDISIANQQMVEIAKSLSYNSKVLIMDEPSTALTYPEIQTMFKVIRDLKANGVGIIYISHRIEELKEISDRISVMRDGEYIGTLETKYSTSDKIITMMVGKMLKIEKEYSNNIQDHIVLEVKNLYKKKSFSNINFSLKKGEILTFFGLVGAGRTEVARSIFGADKLDKGEIFINNKKVRIKNTSDGLKNKICYLSEDRKKFGALVNMDIEFNIILASIKKMANILGFINRKKAKKNTLKYINALNIKVQSHRQLLKNLSGGNQQKVIIAKWLLSNCDILIFDEPTRGIDIKSKMEIYSILKELTNEDKSIIVISSDLAEVLRLGDRIIVMCEGKITGQLDIKEANEEKIMKLSTQKI